MTIARPVGDPNRGRASGLIACLALVTKLTANDEADVTMPSCACVTPVKQVELQEWRCSSGALFDPNAVPDKTTSRIQAMKEVHKFGSYVYCTYGVVARTARSRMSQRRKYVRPRAR